MPAWKKIAALFTLSAAAGILGAACTAEVPETSESAEATVAAETADDVSVDAFGGPGLARSRCGRCRDNYALCGRGRLFGRSPHGAGAPLPGHAQRVSGVVPALLS